MKKVILPTSRVLKPVSLYLENLLFIETLLNKGSDTQDIEITYIFEDDFYKAESVNELVSDCRVFGLEDLRYLDIGIVGVRIYSEIDTTRVLLTLDEVNYREKFIEVVEYLTPLQIENNERRDNIHLYNRGSLKDVERLKAIENLKAIEKSSEIININKEAKFEILRKLNQNGTLTIEQAKIPEKPKINIFKFLSSGVFWAIVGILATIIIGILQLQK